MGSSNKASLILESQQLVPWEKRPIPPGYSLLSGTGYGATGAPLSLTQYFVYAKHLGSFSLLIRRNKDDTSWALSPPPP